MKKYIIRVYTNWCGMDQEYAAIAEDKGKLENKAEELAYDNFSSFDCIYDVADELFPNEEEFSEDQLEAAEAISGEYYGYAIDEFDEDSDGPWELYELIYEEGKNV